MDIQNLAEYIISRWRNQEKPAFLFEGIPVSYKELLTQTMGVSAHLRDIGLSKGDRILIFMNDTPAVASVFLAALSEGVIPIVINPNLSEESLLHILKDSAAKMIFFEHKNANTLAQAVEKHGLHAINLAIQDQYANPNEDMLNNSIVRDAVPFSHLANLKGALSYTSISSDEAAFWQYTSGTTGKPKAVQHNGNTIIENFRGYVLELHKFSSNDIFLSAAKMFFGYGFGASFFFPLMLNATAVLDSRVPTSDLTVLQNITRYKPTVLFANPSIYASLITHAHRVADYLKGMVFISAGMGLPSSIFIAWKETYGSEIYDGIGSTEMCHIYISNSKGSCRPGATGLPVPGYEIKLIPKNHTPTDDENAVTKGVLWVKGQHGHLGYWNNVEKSKYKFEGDWCNTEDIFVRHPDGFYEYCGREDDLFKVNGVWVEPLAIENAALSRVAEVKECALVPYQGANDLVEPYFYYAVSDSSSQAEDVESKLKSIFDEICEAHNYPRKLIKIESLPRNDNGKVSRRALVV